MMHIFSLALNRESVNYLFSGFYIFSIVLCNSHTVIWVFKFQDLYLIQLLFCFLVKSRGTNRSLRKRCSYGLALKKKKLDFYKVIGLGEEMGKYKSPLHKARRGCSLS